MKHDERLIEAVAKAVCTASGGYWRRPPFNHLHTEISNNMWRFQARAAMDAITASGTHWIAPMEITPDMDRAVFTRRSHEERWHPVDEWNSMRDAYLAEHGDK